MPDNTSFSVAREIGELIRAISKETGTPSGALISTWARSAAAEHGLLNADLDFIIEEDDCTRRLAIEFFGEHRTPPLTPALAKGFARSLRTVAEKGGSGVTALMDMDADGLTIVRKGSGVVLSHSDGFKRSMAPREAIRIADEIEREADLITGR